MERRRGMLTYSLGELLKEIKIDETEYTQHQKKEIIKRYTKIRNINEKMITAKMVETDGKVSFIQTGISLENFHKVGNEYIFEEEYYGEDYAFYIEIRINDIGKIFEINDALINLEGNMESMKLSIMANSGDKRTGLYIIKKGTGVITYLCKFRTKKSNISIKPSFITNRKEKYYPSTKNVIMPSQVPWGIMNPYQGGQFMPK